MTAIPHATDLPDWALKIVEGAMIQAQATTGIMHTTFAERIRALSVADADRAGAEAGIKALRAEMHRAVDDSYGSAMDLVGEWWA